MVLDWICGVGWLGVGKKQGIGNWGWCFVGSAEEWLFGGVGDSAEEEDAARFVVADEEEEGVVGAEDDGRLGAGHCVGAQDDSGGGGGFSSLFIYIDEGFVNCG